MKYVRCSSWSRIDAFYDDIMYTRCYYNKTRYVLPSRYNVMVHHLDSLTNAYLKVELENAVVLQYIIDHLTDYSKNPLITPRSATLWKYFTKYLIWLLLSSHVFINWSWIIINSSIFDLDWNLFFIIIPVILFEDLKKSFLCVLLNIIDKSWAGNFIQCSLSELNDVNNLVTVI